MNVIPEQITLAGVQWRFSEGEHDDDDVRWLLAEIDRLTGQVAMEREIGEAFKLAAQDISKQSAAEIATLWKALNAATGETA